MTRKDMLEYYGQLSEYFGKVIAEGEEKLAQFDVVAPPGSALAMANVAEREAYAAAVDRSRAAMRVNHFLSDLIASGKHEVCRHLEDWSGPADDLVERDVRISVTDDDIVVRCGKVIRIRARGQHVDDDDVALGIIEAVVAYIEDSNKDRFLPPM